MNFVSLAENTKLIAQSKAKCMVYNLDNLQKQSLLLASLALVLERIFIATNSAVQAKGTPEGPYRYRESIRTFIRESLGWIGGFVVLRQLQKGIKWGMGKALEIEDIPSPNKFSIFGAIKELRETGAFKKFVPVHDTDLKPILHGLKTNNAGIQALLKLKPSNVNPEVFIRQIHKFAPIALASIPTVMLAGAYLERVTRDHSDHVVDFISQHLGSGSKPQMACPPATPSLPATAIAQYPAAPPFQGAAQQPYNSRFTGTTSPWSNALPPRMPMGYPLGFPAR